jgi:valyl-tRNA synthetase
MDKTYSPAEIEQRWYAQWESQGWFAPRPPASASAGDSDAGDKAAAYCIVIPPPNVTGTLLMGHAFQDTIMDALTRYHRMRGERTLWQPGTDHAGIATQMVVERQLNAAGIKRTDLTREDFLTRVWQSLHDGSWPLARRHRGFRAPARRGPHLPWQAPGQLGSGVAHRALGSRGHQRRGRRFAMAPALPA